MLVRASWCTALLVMTGCSRPPALKWAELAEQTATGFRNVATIEEIPRSDIAKCLYYCYEGLEVNPKNCRLYELLHHCYLVLEARKEMAEVSKEATVQGCSIQ